jgi:mono/diheme cytochrome c family protein
MARHGDEPRAAAGAESGRPSVTPEPAKVRAPRFWPAAFVLGALGAIAAGGLAALLYLELGGFNIAAAMPHTALTYWLTKTTMVRSVKLRTRDITAPTGFSQAQVLAGFRIYDARCVSCHGAPGLDARDRAMDGMTPPPPYLIEAAHEWSPAELYWIIRNGVKMTGMPAWDRACTDQETWQLVAFLEALPHMPSTGYRDLRAATSGAPAPAACSGAHRGAK